MAGPFVREHDRQPALRLLLRVQQLEMNVAGAAALCRGPARSERAPGPRLTRRDVRRCQEMPPLCCCPAVCANADFRQTVQ